MRRLLLILIFFKNEKNNFSNRFCSCCNGVLPRQNKRQVEDATEAVGNDVEQEMDTLATETGEVIDTVQAKTGEALEEGGEKLKEASKK